MGRTAACLVAILCGLAIGAPFVAAQESRTATADQAEVEFRLGNEAYVAGDYSTALSHYFASQRLVPNRNVLFNIARCYENLGSYVEAYRYYGSYLDGVNDPQERRKVEDAVERMAREVGLLVVTSEPPGATIYLDRKDLGSYGVTPALVPVDSGEYDILLERDGHLPARREDVRVGKGERVETRVVLQRVESVVRLTGSPSRVNVKVGDRDAIDVELPHTLNLPIGTEVIEVRAPGHHRRRVAVEVEPDRALEVDVTLDRQLGEVVVESSEANSAIYLDGELVGFTPAVVSSVPVGVRQFVIRQEGFRPFIASVEVAPDERVDLDVMLQPRDEVAAASRQAESIRDAPASVSLISSREIAAFGYTGTHDALLGTRGIYFTNDLTYLQPGIRGYGPFGQFGNRLLVLVDGHAMNDSWLEASFHEFELLSDLYGLDRIEIVRGPTSVLYGSGAFQGVINLVSPPPDDEFRPTRVGVGGAGDGVARSYAHVREQIGPVGLQLSGGVVRGQPRDYRSPALGVADGLGDFWAYSVRANARWKDLTLFSMFHRRDKQSPTGAYETIFGDHRAREADTRGFADVRWQPRLGEAASLDLRTTLDYYAFDGAFPYPDDDGGLFRDTFEGVWWGGEARLALRPFDGARWTAGIEGTRHLLHSALSYRDVDDPLVDLDTPFTTMAVSLQLRHELATWLDVWAGARYDLWLFDELPSPEGGSEPKTINNVNPRLVALLKPGESSTLKLIGSRGFRAPSVYELTYNDGGTTQISSPGLQPETIWSSEAEFAQRIAERWLAVGTLYLQQIDNRIESTGSATSEDPLQFQNAEANLWSAGAEAELQREFFRGVMASVQYTYQRTREGDLGALFEDGANVPNSPAHLAGLKLVTPIVPDALSLAQRVVFESSRIDRLGDRRGPALLWDLMLSGTATPHSLRYAFGFRNLLDWQYSHPVGDEIADAALRQPGRTFVVDVAAQF